MSLSALPVSISDLTTLQQGIQFFTNTAEATSESSAINTPGADQSVFVYAATLLNDNLSLSQVAMADTALIEGGTIAVGNTTTPNTLAFLSTQFLPAQVAVAASLGLNQTVYAPQALGLALAGTTGFQSNFANLSTSDFVTAVANATGVSTSAIEGFVTNWTNFYSGVGSDAHAGLTVQQAAYGAAFGDAIGVALLNPTSAELQTVLLTIGPNGFSPNAFGGLIAGALIENAEGLYATGIALSSGHFVLQGEFVLPGPGGTLTTGVDTVTVNQSNWTVIGTLGGAGAGSTWTAGDTIAAAAGTTGQTFNIDGIGSAAVIDPTTVGPGNSVSGVETVNLSSAFNGNGFPYQAVQGNFTATGTEGDWTGLTTLNVTSGGNATGVDVLTVDPTTAVNVSDTLIAATGAALTVNGGSTVSITEDNSAFHNGGISVNGDSGTTSVSITQTESSEGYDGVVIIVDATGSTATPGTIATIVLDGLTGGTSTEATHNAITDNALANLTVNHTDGDGAILDIANTLATTLNLSLGDNGVGGSSLVINDLHNEYSTVHLTLGAANSSLVFNDNGLEFNDNGLTTLDTLTTGAGALDATFNDDVATAASFNFSGLRACPRK